SLVHRLDVDGHVFEERGRLLDARKHAPLPVFGEGLEVHLGPHPLAVAARLEDLHGALEVDVVDLAVLDLGVGRGGEWALAVFWCRRICWQSAVSTSSPAATSQRNPRALSRR